MKYAISILIMVLCTVSAFAANPVDISVETDGNPTVGDEFTTYITYKNEGSASSKGWVIPSFPASLEVTHTGTGFNTAIVRPGQNIWTTTGTRPATDTSVRSYSYWGPEQQKTLAIRLKAKRAGKQCFKVRAAFHDGTTYQRQPTAGEKDQQGYPADEYCIDVKEPAPGIPQRTAVTTPSATEGQEFQLAFTYRNMQKPTWKGFISANFEDLEVIDAGSNNGLTARISRPGTMIYGNAETMGSNRRFAAQNTVVDFYDNWNAYEMKTGWVTVKAESPGRYCYKLRAAMCNPEWQCNRDPTSGPLDQQEYHTQEYCIDVRPAPPATVRIGKNDWDTILVDGKHPAGSYYQMVNGQRYLMIPAISQKEHNFTVISSKPHYEGYSEIRNINQENYMFYMPSRMKTILRVVVNEQQGNQVLLDGEELCTTWVHTIPGASYVTYKNYCEATEGLAPGTHELEIRLQGHEPVKRTIYLEKGRYHEQEFNPLEPKQYQLKVRSDRENVHIFTNPSTITYQYQGSYYSEDSCDTQLDADGKYSCILEGIHGYVGEPRKQRIFAKYPGYYNSHKDIDLDPDNGLSVNELDLPMTHRIGVQVKVFTVPYSDVFFIPLDGQEQEDHCSSMHRGGERCTFGGQLISEHEPREFERGRYNVTVRPSEIYSHSSFVVDIQDNMTIDARQHVETLRSELTVYTNVDATISISRREYYRDSRGALQHRKIPVKTCTDTDTCTATNLIDYSSGYVIEATAPGYNKAEESTRVDEDTIYSIELIDDSIPLQPLDFGPEEENEPEENTETNDTSDPQAAAFLFGETRIIYGDALSLPLHPANDFEIWGGWCYAENVDCDNHKGIDYVPYDKQGTYEIYSATDGKVVRVENDEYDNLGSPPNCQGTASDAYGERVHVMYEDPEEELYEIVYGHFKRDTITVEVGDDVQAGDALGIMGNTGCSSDQHLHFEVRTRDKTACPKTHLGMCGSFTKIDPYDLRARASAYPDKSNNYSMPCGEDHMFATCPPASEQDLETIRNIQIESIDPHEVNIGQQTTFTVTGEGMTDDMVLFVPHCDNTQKTKSTPTEQKWTCTFQTTEPGAITLEIKNRPKSEGGVLLRAYTMMLSAPPTGGGGSW